MLTVDYRRLEAAPGDTLLDVGCGAGRHAFEAFRRGIDVVAFDFDDREVKEARGLLHQMDEAGEAAAGARWAGACGDAVRLPFADATFDRVIASEVMEHVHDDTAAIRELARVVRPGGTIAVTVPSFLPEALCWALSDDYHAPAEPGGHVRIYTWPQLRARFVDAGLRPYARHRAHALHSPYWWLKCAVGVRRADHPLVRAYHRMLVWDIERAPLLTRTAERALDPVLGKSTVAYARVPGPGGAA